VFADILPYIVIFLITFAGGFIQSLGGIGSAAVMMTVLPWFFTPLETAGVIQMVGIVYSVGMLIKLRKSVDLRFALPPTIIYTVLSVISIQLVKGLDMNLLSALFGGFLLLLAVWFFFFENKVRIPAGRGSMVICSAASGVLGGVFGVGGPTMALWVLSATEDRLLFLSTLQVIFTASNIISTITRAVNGILTMDLVRISLVGMVGIFIGGMLGLKAMKKLNPEYFRKAVYICVGFSGLMQLVNKLIH